VQNRLCRRFWNGSETVPVLRIEIYTRTALRTDSRTVHQTCRKPLLCIDNGAEHGRTPQEGPAREFSTSLNTNCNVANARPESPGVEEKLKLF
jgi:hypothetical protein